MTTEELYRYFREAGSVCTDTRKIIPGSMFFALKGDNFNGNLYAAQALEKGCSIAVVDEDLTSPGDHFIRVKDVLKSLQDLAAFHRSQFDIPLIGITGTNGKTTTKELINAVLSRKFKVKATTGNLNNHIGVPLSLLEINSSTQIAIIEMGANHTGEIAGLCELAKPTHAIITNIGNAHLEGFGSPEKVVEAKNELYEYIRKTGGMAFLNIDDPVLLKLSDDLNKIGYGISNEAGVQAINKGEVFSSLEWRSLPDSDSWQKVQTHLVGGYNFYNILAAITIGHHFGVDADLIRDALENYMPGMNRSQYIETKYNRLILDAYNANPDSMKAAIANFRDIPSDRKAVILGDMFELGAYSDDAHLQIIRDLISPSFCRIILVGPEFYRLSKDSGTEAFPDLDSLKIFLKEENINETVILLKGSRGMKMESLLDYL